MMEADAGGISEILAVRRWSDPAAVELSAAEEAALVAASKWNHKDVNFDAIVEESTTARARVDAAKATA